MKMYKCPCCGYYTLHDVSPGSDDICKVCYWEDDIIQYEYPTFEDGPNNISFNQAKENFKKIGAISEEYRKFVRKPRWDELEENQPKE